MTEHEDDTVRPESDPPAKDVRAAEPVGAQRDEPADAFTLAAPEPVPTGRPESGSLAGGMPTEAPAAPTPLPPDPPGVTPDYDKYGVPSLDFVRNKIEGRYATSVGAAELAQQTWEATSAQERAAEREKSAQEALERIRQSLRDNKQS